MVHHSIGIVVCYAIVLYLCLVILDALLAVDFCGLIPWIHTWFHTVVSYVVSRLGFIPSCFIRCFICRFHTWFHTLFHTMFHTRVDRCRLALPVRSGVLRLPASREIRLQAFQMFVWWPSSLNRQRCVATRPNRI